MNNFLRAMNNLMIYTSNCCIETKMPTIENAIIAVLLSLATHSGGHPNNIGLIVTDIEPYIIIDPLQLESGPVNAIVF